MLVVVINNRHVCGDTYDPLTWLPDKQIEKNQTLTIKTNLLAKSLHMLNNSRQIIIQQIPYKARFVPQFVDTHS